jgi:DNA-binding response OmpR family regulator
MSQEQPGVSTTDVVKTILIVEDEDHISEFLERVISEETPYKPLVVTDGFEALKVTLEVKPNLFLLDYHLPGMDGIELYDRLHSVKAFQDIPALIMSARLPKRELDKRSLVGLHKPLELSELLQKIQELLER